MDKPPPKPVSKDSCDFSFVCSKKWAELRVVPGDRGQRFCMECSKPVYRCDTAQEWEDRRRAGQCVAIMAADSESSEGKRELVDEPLLDPSEIMGIPIFEDERSPEELKTAAAEAAQAAAQEKRDRQMMERLLRDAIPKPGRAPQQHCEHRHYVFKPEPLIGLVVFGDENMPIPPCIAYLRRRDTDGAHKGKSQQPQTLGDVAKEMRQVVEDEDAFIRVVEKLGRNRKEEWKLTADLHDTSGILRALLGAVVSNNTRPECGELQSLVYSCGNGIIGGYR